MKDDMEQPSEQSTDPAEVSLPPVKGERVNKVGLGRVFGLSQPTLDRYLSDGLPFLQRAGRRVMWAFDTAAVYDWLVNRAVNLATASNTGVPTMDSAKRRDKEAQARLRELQVQEREGSLVPLDKVLELYAREATEFRNRLNEIPRQISNLTPAQVAELTEALEKALLEFAGGKQYEPSTDD